MIGKKNLRQMFDLLLIVLIIAGCSRAPAGPPTPTPVPTTGSLTGTILDTQGKSFVDLVDTGYVVLYCPGDAPGVECLHKGYEDVDPSALLASICDLTNRASNCRVHLMTSAADVRGDGKYNMLFVHPGQYDLILIVVHAGIMMQVHLLNVGPVEAGKVTRYDFAGK